MRFSRCPTYTTSDHCLGHQNHLRRNRSWSMGWVPPAVPPTAGHAGSQCQARPPGVGPGLGGFSSGPGALGPAAVVLCVLVFAVCVLLAGKVRRVKTGGDSRGNPGESTELFTCQAFARAS